MKPARRPAGTARVAGEGAHHPTTKGCPPGVVTLYTKPDCHLCEDALAVLLRVREEIPFELRQLDITRDEGLHRAYFERIPVVALDGEHLFDFFVDERALIERLESRRWPTTS